MQRAEQHAGEQLRPRAAGQELALGNLSLDAEGLSVAVAGQSVSLTLQEFELLLLLAGRADRMVTQEELALRLWGQWSRRQRTHLAVLIARLRNKLRDSFPYRIETVRKRGYGLLRAR